MCEDWWPTILSHIPTEDPWRDDPVTVAEVRGFDTPYYDGRTVLSALVPSSQLGALRKKLHALSVEVDTSGPFPFFDEDGDEPYRPSFWIRASDDWETKFEPLVLTWHSASQTVLLVDPGFLMTYGLVPRRPSNQKSIHWDDPRVPRYNIVQNSFSSIQDFTEVTSASVKINRDYLQDYLTLRQMALVQVYWEVRYGTLDEEIAKRLGDEQGISFEFSDHRMQLSRIYGDADRHLICAEVWGARLLAKPGDAPISTDPSHTTSLEWPGIDGKITARNVGQVPTPDYVYFKDSVLAEYEGRSEYQIYPEGGGVSLGHQWSVGGTRVGRDLIRLNLRKFYEGAPFAVIKHWHSHAAPPVPIERYPEIFDEPNVAKRARAITYGLVSLGEALAQLARKAGEPRARSADFVGLEREKLDDHGWWTQKEAEAISRHIPMNLSEEDLLDRTLSLVKLIVEMLKESALRQLLNSLDVSKNEIKNISSLKLLDRMVCMALKAKETGLDILSDGAGLYERLRSEDVRPTQPISSLFAIYDLRLLKGHRADSSYIDKRNDALARFGILPQDVDIDKTYANMIDTIYDSIIEQLKSAALAVATCA